MDGAPGKHWMDRGSISRPMDGPGFGGSLPPLGGSEGVVRKNPGNRNRLKPQFSTEKNRAGWGKIAAGPGAMYECHLTPVVALVC